MSVVQALMFTRRRWWPAFGLPETARVEKEVRTFKTTTADLLALGEWLDGHDVNHVVMEATGVYWKPVWHILDDGERELVLANAAHVKNLPGHKSDVSDCDWLSDLEAHGLIRASFVPDRQTQELRGLLRTRKQLVRERPATRCACRRRWRTPTSSSTR